MAHEFDCGCGARLGVPYELAGKSVRCPACRAVVVAPDVFIPEARLLDDVPTIAPLPFSPASVVARRAAPARRPSVACSLLCSAAAAALFNLSFTWPDSDLSLRFAVAGGLAALTAVLFALASPSARWFLACWAGVAALTCWQSSPLRFGGPSTVALVPPTAESDICRDQMHHVEWAVEAWSARHGGALPESLDALTRRRHVTDSMGNPLLFEKSPDGYVIVCPKHGWLLPVKGQR